MSTTEPLPPLTRNPTEDLLTRKQVLKYLAERGAPVSKRTLDDWATKPGRGPVFHIFHRTVRYLRADLDDWLRRAVRRVV